MADGKMFGAWLSGPLLESAEKKANAVADGNYSKYVRALIERDVNTSPTTLLLELAKQFQPALTEDLARSLAARSPVDGRKVIARFLDAYLAALGDPSFRPEQAFELLSGEQKRAFDMVAEDRLEYLARKVFEFQQSATKPKSAEVPSRPKPGKKQSPRATGQPKLTAHPSDQSA